MSHNQNLQLWLLYPAIGRLKIKQKLASFYSIVDNSQKPLSHIAGPALLSQLTLAGIG